MNRVALVKIICCLLVTRVATDDNPDDDELTDDELGTVAEDLSEYSWQAGLRSVTGRSINLDFIHRGRSCSLHYNILLTNEVQ